MQVQLIVANEQNNGKIIPVNVPSFMIGRAEGCNLRSRSSHVSRYHCVINVENGQVVIQDLGGGNGTAINGNRISSAAQTLKDGDKVEVGTHSFVVSITAGNDKSTASSTQHFELMSNVTNPSKQEQSDTRPIDPNKATVVLEAEKKSAQEPEVLFEIRLDGQRVTVSKTKLFELARKGTILPDDLVIVAGTKVFADSIQGIIFGDKPPAGTAPASAVSNQPLPPNGSSVQLPSAPAPVTASDPFAFPDLGNIAAESNPFDSIASEPSVRIARRESAAGALWKALDISFSRVYTLEGNNLVIHSIKALYYVLVVICFIFMLFTVIEFCTDWYENGIFLENLRKHYVGLASAAFGGVTIIVVVRVLLEMLLLAWFESNKTEHPKERE